MLSFLLLFRVFLLTLKAPGINLRGGVDIGIVFSTMIIFVTAKIKAQISIPLKLLLLLVVVDATGIKLS